MKEKKKNKAGMSLPTIMSLVVMSIVGVAFVIALMVFLSVYSDSIEQNVVITSEQSVVQVSNMVSNYVRDTKEVMALISDTYAQGRYDRDSFFINLMKIRSDVVAITSYNEEGVLLSCWSNGYELKPHPLANLSYHVDKLLPDEDIHISEPHAETLLLNYYPWVVTITESIYSTTGKQRWVAMDIRFSQIANYVDDVGIGQHGYCYIIDTEGNLIYHPQQQLIYAGIKEENTDIVKDMEDGSAVGESVIYTVKSLENCNWRIVGVSYIDEMVTDRLQSILLILGALLLVVLFTALISSFVLSRKISRPINGLIKAMGDFEKNATAFSFQSVQGSIEIKALSDSFGHMVVRIQELMEKVRNEEISLRKTELKALQAQINPHFLYNTLDAIGWLCEEERNQDAVEMVNALAKLFRISISKGHELIPIENEIQHAESYLRIEKFRYKNQFTYDFLVNESCLSYYCNKITLQPIIENAIYHGLNRMVDEGKITITVEEDGDDILFIVADNGIGMSKEQCDTILGKEPNDRTGIGIKNVNDRIKIYFGEEYGLSIVSELDEGTTVTIRMPKVMEGTYDSK